jgi:pimeloyl-ACP methyl ester carboxylesterase
VVAVQNPLTSLADDVAATRKVIESQPGPVVLVGHSWGGVVITQAGNESKVAALVYVAAFAPATGQSIDSIVAPFPAPAWESHLVSDGGPLKLSPYGVRRTLRRT